MIKLKLTREQLFTLCAFTNPAKYEAKAERDIEWKNFGALDTTFNIIHIGEAASKKYLYTNKGKYSIRLKYAEGASLLVHVSDLLVNLNNASYEHNVALKIMLDLHAQLIGFQRKFNGQSNTQTFLIGGDQGAGGALANLT